MSNRLTEEDWAHRIAEQSDGLELYYEELASQQLLRRASDQIDDSTSRTRRSSDRSESPLDIIAQDAELLNSYQSFLNDHDALAKQATGMKNGVWIDAAEFSARNHGQQTARTDRAKEK